MKKTTKRTAPKAAHKKPVRNLRVKPAKGATVRGGEVRHTDWIEIQSTQWSHDTRLKS